MLEESGMLRRLQWGGSRFEQGCRVYLYVHIYIYIYIYIYMCVYIYIYIGVIICFLVVGAAVEDAPSAQAAHPPG